MEYNLETFEPKKLGLRALNKSRKTQKPEKLGRKNY